MPRVSVLLPLYRPHIPFLKEAIACLKAQTFTDFEAILFNQPWDCDVLGEIREDITDPRFRFIQSDLLRGIGANCATLMYGIARDAGVLPPGAPMPKWYSPQLHVHSREERLVESVKLCGGVLIPDAIVKPGDVVAYLTGKSHGHLAMVIEWDRCIVQTHKATGAQYGHGREGRLRGCRMEFYSLWAPTSTPNPPGKGDLPHNA